MMKKPHGTKFKKESEIWVFHFQSAPLTVPTGEYEEWLNNQLFFYVFALLLWHLPSWIKLVNVELLNILL